MAQRSPDRRTPATPFEVGSYDDHGTEVAYEIHGTGSRVLLYMHGILMDSKMNRRLAGDLAARGFRVVLVDLPGHGRSTRSLHATSHRMDVYADHVVALAEHLGLTSFAVGGVSLGADVALMVAERIPDRVKAMVIEMPVLEYAIPTAALTFVPTLFAVHFVRGALRVVARLFSRIPETGHGAIDSGISTIARDPAETAAVLHGIITGPIAPTRESRLALTMPALLIGHRIDRLHPFADAERLERHLPNAQLVEAHSILELRIRPERLTESIAGFLDETLATRRSRRKAG